MNLSRNSKENVIAVKAFFDKNYKSSNSDKTLHKFIDALNDGFVKTVETFCKPIDPKVIPFADKQIETLNTKWDVFTSIRDQLMIVLESALEPNTQLKDQHLIWYLIRKNNFI